MRFVMLACLVALATAPISAQTTSGPTPGEVPDTPGFWRQWEGEAKTAAAARAVNDRPVKLSTEQDLYDVHFYDLDLDLDHVNELITGTVTMRATVVGPLLRMVDLNMQSIALIVDAVRVAGQPAAYTHVANLLSVDLGSDHTMGQEIEVTVDYHGNPNGLGAFGWAWADTERLIWTLSEPFGARTWWPCKDLNHDKADSVDLHIAVDPNMIVASNGLLVGEEMVDGRRVFHWQERYPICTYLVSVAAYPYLVFTDTYTSESGATMPIVNYVVPSYEQEARDGYGVTAEMISAFADGFGEYPFIDEKYGHAAFTWGGGMEHQTCSSMIYWYFGEGLTAHELAHQWWGDMVTCKSFHHIWLNEGFATWSEAYWLEQSDGPQAYRDDLANNRYTGGGTIYVENPDNFGSIFDSNLSYNKASWVVHMLRGVVGDEDFFAGLALYRERFEYGAADTEDLQGAMEEVSGQDLGPFFQQWIYGEYYPRYRFAYLFVPDGENTTAHVRIDQIQTNTGLFTMPIPIRFITDQGDHWVTLENEREVQYYTLTVPGEGWAAQFDPDEWILRDAFAGTITDVPSTSSALSLTAYPNPFNPQTTLRMELGAAGPARLALHDAAGRLVRVLVDGDLPAGANEIAWNGRDGQGRTVAAGVYFAVAEAGGKRETARLALVK